MASPRLPTRITRRARARTRIGWARSERATVGLAALALAGAQARCWSTNSGGCWPVAPISDGRRRSSTGRERRNPEGLLEVAPAAALDTVGVAVSGYSAAPRAEVVLFNLLAGFLGSFATVRLSTWGIRNRQGPFRNVRIGGYHIHHFVPGILIAFASGDHRAAHRR